MAKDPVCGWKLERVARRLGFLRSLLTTLYR